MKKLNNILDIVSTYNNVGGTKHHDISLSLYIHQTYLGWTKKKTYGTKAATLKLSIIMHHMYHTPWQPQ